MCTLLSLQRKINLLLYVNQYFFLKERNLLFFGGGYSSEDGASDSFYYWDTRDASNEWVQLPNTPVEFDLGNGFGGAVMQEKINICGEYDCYE